VIQSDDFLIDVTQALEYGLVLLTPIGIGLCDENSILLCNQTMLLKEHAYGHAFDSVSEVLKGFLEDILLKLKVKQMRKSFSFLLWHLSPFVFLR
jgi:hypothetical protein